MTSLLDEIAAEVSNLSDEEIAAAASKIAERQAKARASMTPERKEKMKQREARRRKLNAAILKAAKEKGLLTTPATESAEAGA